MRKISATWLVLIQWALAVEWLHSGWGKWSGPGFMGNIGKTFIGFTAKNPNGWYVSFLNSTATPHAIVFGNIIRSGELLIGIALVLGGVLLLAKKRLPAVAIWLLVVAFFGGALMNLNFYFAAGWTSPSTWGVNVVMCLAELILGLCYLLNRRELSS